MLHMKVLVVTLLLFAAHSLGWPDGQATAQSRRPVVFSTQPQTVTLSIRSPDAPLSVTIARVTYTITSANIDDTLTGTLTLSPPGEPKKQRRSERKVPVDALPQSFSQENVAASFRSRTSCPLIRIEIGPITLSLGGRLVEVSRFDLVINETKAEVSQLLCFWSKQISTTGPRRGIAAKINRLINGDDQAQ